MTISRGASTVLGQVIHVVLVRIPAQVAERSVRCNTVVVADLVTDWARADECGQYQISDAICSRGTIETQCDGWVPAVSVGRLSKLPAFQLIAAAIDAVK